MNSSNYDVVVVGAGAAGLTAAIGLARAGFAVAVVEAAAFPGAENWSGCVYFCENLAHLDILGPDGVEALAWERRLVQRGFFATDGHGLLGMTYRDPNAFRHCYTVLRPIYDHHLAQVALRHGVALLCSTTAESLIRDQGRVIGVCTQRGPLYADLVFLAEGDASQLVTREGYERFTDPREAPKFLQGIKQVLELPAGVIENRFQVGPEEGVAYEMLLRNGTLRGKSVRLNMGGFLYTNRQSLSVGLVLPVDNLNENFGGDPNLLLEWFENLPSLRPWLEGCQRGVFGAKLIRGGGARDIPTLIDDGLAIGGAASAIGIDFPYPNFTGPATAMGLLLAQAAVRIRAEGGSFTRDNLRRYYLEPLQQTHYWQDVEFLRRWPGYVKKTQAFFGRDLDLALGSAYLWTRPKRWFLTKWNNWLRMVLQVAGPGQWRDLQKDAQHLGRALRLNTVLPRPALARWLIDGTANALRDLFGQPRANLPPAGAIQLHYSVAGGAEASGAPPASFQRWFRRFAPVLASAARRVYSNDTVPLATKLPSALKLLAKQVNLLDFLGAACLAAAGGAFSALLVAWDRLRKVFRRGLPVKLSPGLYPPYAEAARQTTDLTAALASATQHWETRLAQLAYQTVKESHIHVLWPRTLADKNAVVNEGLFHVCPAHVYEARVSLSGQVQVVVNFENCIKCETCWRSSDLVDWGRDGLHRFIYAVHSPVVLRLLEEQEAAALNRPILPRLLDPWQSASAQVAERLQSLGDLAERNGRDEVAELVPLLDRLERKLLEFDEALAEEPRTIDRGRAEYLEMLARYAQQLALRLLEVIRDGDPVIGGNRSDILKLATALTARAEERARQVWNEKFAWAAADGRQLRQHHLAGLRRLLEALDLGPPSVPPTPPSTAWLRSEADQDVSESTLDTKRRLDAVLPSAGWRDLERPVPLSKEADAAVRALLAQVPVIDAADLPGTLHPPQRKALLAELARRDPSLAYRAAVHLWARDLARLATVSSPLAAIAQRWANAEEWACFAVLENLPTTPAGSMAEALFIPAGQARRLLLLLGDTLAVVEPEKTSSLTVEPLPTLGLRGAGLSRLRLTGDINSKIETRVDRERILRLWSVLSAADLTSIASGMAEQLCLRAIDHATGRVQFPGLFHDEEARDTIGKFGAIKKMIAEMGARRYLIETLDHCLTPVDFSASSMERAGLVKAVVAEALGTTPGSLSYNAGQVFGGTGYSEDDILSKFYRDAAAWRFLGPENVHVFRRHGESLLRSWRPSETRLSRLLDEAQLFEQLAQRKALQAELDQVRVLRSRLRGLVTEWKQAEHSVAEAAAEVSEALGRQDALLLASKALLLRTHARLEKSLTSETETILLRVWLEGAAAALQEFEALVRRRLAPATLEPDRPLVDPGAGPPVTRYADFLAAACPYDSGDFLNKPVDLLQPRYVPEMNESDPALAARNRELQDLLGSHFGAPRDGLGYERYMERQHRPDARDLDFCRRHGFFRMPIPKDLGGEGISKVDYYLLTTNAHRLADVGISLCIQVNSSLGTTPVLLARDKDLPKAQKDAESFAGDSALREGIREQLQALIGLFTRNNPKVVEFAYRDLQKRLQESIFSRPALRVLAHAFVQAWQQAGRAGLDYDLDKMRVRLQEALDAWQEAGGRAAEFAEEIGRRREACDLFLRWVASGQISAFALTEPSAGSDTARVATRARLRSVPVEVEPDGVLRFIPPSGKEPRYLLDAARLEFRPIEVEGKTELQACYRWSNDAEPAPIHFDEYDYETDDPEKMRYYDHGSRRIHFSDIAQVRQREGQLWYDYWELTGAKMWITNGRMCGIMCLYAKTDEGVTGFIVDRHAEGLIVGKDEAKMGQLGSPTNELSLQAVRVPRENVIGLEGRGQVNALETLNVGRAGLAMSAMCQMKTLIDWSRTFIQKKDVIPDWAAWRLERMEEDRFIAEALAHEVIGRFEHKQTKSVRLESAIAKMLVSELLHRVIETAEEIHGLAGQTELHLVEKRKRDARVLNIYEGTNEIQRFFILKDLATEVAPRWTQAPAPPPPAYLGREALELETLKAALRQRVQSALETLGQELWQNPNLQANCFLLSEAVAWLKAADSTLGRLAWLSRQTLSEDVEPPQLELARRALQRCGIEVGDRLRRFDEELAHLRRGYYAPEVRAATLLFKQAGPGAKPFTPSSRITRPLSVLVVLEPPGPGVPNPHVGDGRLLEPYRVFNEADHSALEAALRLRDQGTDQVRIEVATVGPRSTAQVLREVLSLGVENVRLIVSDTDALTPDSAAAALATVLRSAGSFDLVLGGSGGADEEGVLARLTAAALRATFVGTAAQLAVQTTRDGDTLLLVGSDGKERIRSLPAAVNIEAGLRLRPFTIAGYLAGLSKTVTLEPWPRAVEVRPASFVETYAPGSAPTAEQPHPLLPAEAGRWLLDSVGHGSDRGAVAASFSGPILDVEEQPFDTTRERVLAVIAADDEGRLRPTAARTIAAATVVAQTVGDENLMVVLVASPNEDAQRRAVGQLLTQCTADVLVLVLPGAEVSDEVRSRLLEECWSGLKAPIAVIGEPWTEGAWARLSCRAQHAEPTALKVHSLAQKDGQLIVQTQRHRGKLRVRQMLRLPSGQTTWIALDAEAEVSPGRTQHPVSSFRVVRWAPSLNRFYSRSDIQRLLDEVKEETGLERLSDADFILDVGFGVGNRDGYEAVIEPLERALRALGVRNLVIGGSRKVTEELHLLPADRQIGQSGVSVNPRILLAIGISGAPQHLNYIGPRATILAFNRDPEAPIMTLNQRQPQPRVFPVIGDLFETVPALIAALQTEQIGEDASV
jgi:electron transfer flavoprotein-quinone oxidoreductase